MTLCYYHDWKLYIEIQIKFDDVGLHICDIVKGNLVRNNPEIVCFISEIFEVIVFLFEK